MTTLMVVLIFSSSGIIGLISLYPLLKPYCGHEVDFPVDVKNSSSHSQRERKKNQKPKRYAVQHMIYKNTRR